MCRCNLTAVVRGAKLSSVTTRELKKLGVRFLPRGIFRLAGHQSVSVKQSTSEFITTKRDNFANGDNQEATVDDGEYVQHDISSYVPHQTPSVAEHAPLGEPNLSGVTPQLFYVQRNQVRIQHFSVL